MDIVHSMSSYHVLQMGRDARKPVFGVSDMARLKQPAQPQRLARNEISLVSSLDMILYNKRITKALISLSVCEGWSASLLFANHRRMVFSRRGPNV